MWRAQLVQAHLVQCMKMMLLLLAVSAGACITSMYQPRQCYGACHRVVSAVRDHCAFTHIGSRLGCLHAIRNPAACIQHSMR